MSHAAAAPYRYCLNTYTYRIVFVIAILLSKPYLKAAQPNYRLCFPQVVGVPVLTTGSDPCGHPLVAGQPPNIDGCVSGDPGWTGAFRYVAENGSSFPAAAVQGNSDGTFLYLSFEVYHDFSYDSNDLIILVLSPTGNAADDRRIHIYPNSTNTLKNGVQPRLINYWSNSSTWNSSPPQSLPKPDTITAVVGNRGDVASSDVNWSVEMKIRLADFKIPSTGFFGIYFDILPIGGGLAPQYYWPSRSSAGSSNGIPGNVVATPTLVDSGTPGSVNWGNGTLSAPAGQACAGVSLDAFDIKSNHSDFQVDATCSLGMPDCNTNIFTATPSNSSVSASDGTTPIQVSNVTATFSIANFGLSSEWTPIPAGSPPGSSPPVTLNPSCSNLAVPCASLQTAPWHITDSTLINNYKTNADQCIKVDLDVASPSTSNCVTNPAQCVTFLNKSVRRNMWILTASQVSKKAEISAKGYSPNPAHPAQQQFRLRILQREEVLPAQADANRVAGASGSNKLDVHKGKVISRLSWIVEGCRFTGQYIRIQDQELETCDDVGAFGAIVTHLAETAVSGWEVDLEGPGLTRVDDAKGIYNLVVPQSEVATISVRFVPKETLFSRWAAFFDLGGAFPHGTFGTAFNPGFSLNAGLEYMVTSHFSAEGIFGYHRFPGKFTGDLNVYQFSGNAKVYLVPPQKFRLFLNGGIGAYKFSPGSGNFGGNFGGGVLYELTPRFGLQGSYNFHGVNTTGGATKFSTIQGGIRYVF